MVEQLTTLSAGGIAVGFGFTVVAYLMGSISTAILVCRALGFPDPRTDGSRNPGATNVLRIAGKIPALLTLIGDVVKGMIPLGVAIALDVAPAWLGFIGLAAFCGHLFPIFFRFEGGKGVATALGVIHLLSWQAGLAVIGVWLVVAAVFRISSLAALVSWGLAPFLIYWLAPHHTVAISLMTLMLIYRHKHNIRQILAGTERKIGEKS